MFDYLWCLFKDLGGDIKYLIKYSLMRYHYSTFKWSTGQAHHYLQQRRWGSQITCIPHPWSSQYCWLPPGNTLCYSLTTSFLPHCCAPRIWRKWKENSSAENSDFSVTDTAGNSEEKIQVQSTPLIRTLVGP